MTSPTGTFSERLPCGGTLIVSAAQQGISYSYPGRDRRYSWTHFFLDAAVLARTAKALRTNWAEYESIKSKLPAKTEFSKPGLMDMQIRLGSAYPGVWIRSFHLGARNAFEAERIAASFELALQRIEELKPLLKDF